MSDLINNNNNNLNKYLNPEARQQFKNTYIVLCSDEIKEKIETRNFPRLLSHFFTAQYYIQNFKQVELRKNGDPNALIHSEGYKKTSNQWSRPLKFKEMYGNLEILDPLIQKRMIFDFICSYYIVSSINSDQDNKMNLFKTYFSSFLDSMKSDSSDSWSWSKISNSEPFLVGKKYFKRYFITILRLRINSAIKKNPFSKKFSNFFYYFIADSWKIFYSTYKNSFNSPNPPPLPPIPPQQNNSTAAESSSSESSKSSYPHLDHLINDPKISILSPLSSTIFDENFKRTKNRITTME